MKLKLKLDDPQTLAVWETIQRAKAEVASWPAWKRGEETGSAAPNGPAPSKTTDPAR